MRRYDADYPDIGKVLKLTGEKVTLPKALAEVCDRAGIFSKENEADYVLVDVRPGEIQVRADGISGWYVEPRKLKYKGEERTFLIPPQILADLVQRHNEVHLSQHLVQADLGSYVYLSALRAPASKNGTGKHAD